MVKIHSTAFVDPKAQVGENVEIGPLSQVNEDVIIGDNTIIGNGCILDEGTRLGKKPLSENSLPYIEEQLTTIRPLLAGIAF